MHLVYSKSYEVSMKSLNWDPQTAPGRSLIRLLPDFGPAWPRKTDFR